MRLIDADALMDTLRKDFTEEENDHQFIAEEWWWAATVRKTIENAPTVDAVAVVRCEDCKEYDEEKHWCGIRDSYGWDYKPNDYCSYGVRKAEEDADT